MVPLLLHALVIAGRPIFWQVDANVCLRLFSLASRHPASANARPQQVSRCADFTDSRQPLRLIDKE